MTEPSRAPARAGVEVDFEVDAGSAGSRIDKLIADHVGRPRSQVGVRSVRVDGASARVQDRPRAGARIEASLAAPVDHDPSHADVDFDIAYSDADIIVADKPPGLAVHPPRTRPEQPSLIGGLLRRYPEIARLSEPGAEERPGVVHRLDRDTSGLVVVARDADAYARLKEMVVDRVIRRRYIALVSGGFDVGSGCIDAPIGRRPGSRRFRVDEAGRPARTNYEVLAAWRRPELSLLAVELVTGRTHQIRVHMSSIGHPVVGDRTYRGSSVFGADRQFLHAAELDFAHPVSGLRLEITSRLPADLRVVLGRAGPPDTGHLRSQTL